MKGKGRLYLTRGTGKTRVTGSSVDLGNEEETDDKEKGEWRRVERVRR